MADIKIWSVELKPAGKDHHALELRCKVGGKEMAMKLEAFTGGDPKGVVILLREAAIHIEQEAKRNG